MDMTEQFRLTAERAEDLARGVFVLVDRVRAKGISLADTYDGEDIAFAENDTRHVLVIRENGDYGLEHDDTASDHIARACADVQHALGAFITHIDRGDNAGMHLREPGRYWCSVSDDGILEIGGAIRGD